MVRSLIGRVCAALTAAAIAALCAATPSLAVEVLEVEQPEQQEQIYQQTTPVISQEQTLPTLQEIDASVDDLTIELTNSNSTVNQKLTSIDENLTSIKETLDTNNQEDERSKSETEYLDSIDSKLSIIVDNTKQPEEIKQLGAKASNIAFVAYANVSPNGTYANYAAGYLPKLKYNEHYVFVQDTTSSHVLIMGDITQPDINTFQGSDVRWVRWYYQNNTNGYVVEQGQSDVTVTCNNHTVLSDLPRYPDLPQYSQELLRKEVGFYALVLVCCSVFRDVWSWLVRMRNYTAVNPD